MKVATECLEDTSLRQYILRRLGRRVRTEFTQLQSLAVNSVMRQQSKESLVDFKWSSIIEEIKLHAPTLYEFLKACTVTRTPRPNRESIIGMCAAILCKFRSPEMSAAQKTVSLILYSGHSSKKVSNCCVEINRC